MNKQLSKLICSILALAALAGLLSVAPATSAAAPTAVDPPLVVQLREQILAGIAKGESVEMAAARTAAAFPYTAAQLSARYLAGFNYAATSAPAPVYTTLTCSQGKVDFDQHILGSLKWRVGVYLRWCFKNGVVVSGTILDCVWVGGFMTPILQEGKVCKMTVEPAGRATRKVIFHFRMGADAKAFHAENTATIVAIMSGNSRRYYGGVCANVVCY